MDTAIIIPITAVLAVLLTVAGVVGTWMALRTAKNTQSLQNFRDAALSWREKAEATEADLKAVREELSHTQAQLADLMAKHAALQDVVTGKAALEALTTKVDQVKTDIVLEIHVNRNMLKALVDKEEANRSNGR